MKYIRTFAARDFNLLHVTLRLDAHGALCRGWLFLFLLWCTRIILLSNGIFALSSRYRYIVTRSAELWNTCLVLT